MTATTLDAVVIGGGIAGASVAAFLAQDGVKSGLFEMESSLAYHTTGRSAALLTPHYGPDSIQAFASIGRSFLENPTVETDDPLITPKYLVTVTDEEHVQLVERPPSSLWWSEAECMKQVPFLKQGKFIGAVIDTEVASIDVHALHSLYLKMFTNGGGQIFRDANISTLKQNSSGVWEFEIKSEIFQSPIIINAAGAWGDEIAGMAGIGPVGLVPKRRTVIVVDENQFTGTDFDSLPFVVVEPDYVYFQKFGSGKLMISPADKTPTKPCDAQPDEMDIAIGASRFEEVTTLNIRRIDHSWAGLRTFSPDNDPVIGWEPNREGFFWLVGQGGYGVFSSPAIGRYAASLIANSTPPKEYQESGYPFEALSPDRFRLTLSF